MKLASNFAAKTRKAFGVAIAGGYAWAQLVVHSSAPRITADEWLVLGGVGVAVAACYGLTNRSDEPA